MIDRIKALVLGNGNGKDKDKDNGGANSAAPANQADDLTVAAVALLIEAAVMDGEFDAAERASITRLLEERFDLSAAEIAAVIGLGEEKVEQAHQLYAFTSVIKQGFDFEERIQMIEMLWEVAYADGDLHDFEANLVRRIAGLIHVADRDSGAARKRVLARCQETPAPS